MARPLLFLSAAALTASLFAGTASAGTLSPNMMLEMEGAAPDDLVRALVMMPDQLDKPAFVAEMKATGKTMHERHVAAVTRLQALAGREQIKLLGYLQEQMLKDTVVDFDPLWIINGVIVTATRTEIEAIAARDDVRIVYPDYPISLIAPVEVHPDGPERGAATITGASGPGMQTIEEGIASTRAPELWDMGIDGTGVIVGDMDTGADGDHPAFADRYLGLRKPADQCWFDPVTFTTFPVEFGFGHGTHTMGTMIGSDGANQIGMAPGAEWIAAGVIDRISIDRTIADAILAFEWFADPDGDPGTSDDVPCVVNNSWGISPLYHGVPECDETFWSVIDNCEAAGCAVVYAAGNEGSGAETLRTPADRIASDVNVFSVGALDVGSNSIAYFSSRGPSGCDHQTIKPEVTARGMDVRSSMNNGTYGTMSGTSMACPHVAGAVALLKSAVPEATPEDLKMALLHSAVDLGASGDDNTYGMGRIDLVAALDWLGGGSGRLTITLDPVTDPVRVPAAGGNVDFDWSISNSFDTPQSFDGWLVGEYSGGGSRVVAGPYALNLAAGETQTGSASLPMSGSLPDGNYTATAYIGTYPNDVVDSDSFGIFKGDAAPNLLTFDDIADQTPVGGHYAGVTFSPGWAAWRSEGNTYYPPHSTPNTAYTWETSNSIAWDTPVDNLSLYVSCYTGYGDTYYYSVYDSGGAMLEQIATQGGQNVAIQFTVGGISELRVTGTGQWSNHHAIDDVAYDQ